MRDELTKGKGGYGGKEERKQAERKGKGRRKLDILCAIWICVRSDEMSCGRDRIAQMVSPDRKGETLLNK